jgi:hypothetical protein
MTMTSIFVVTLALLTFLVFFVALRSRRKHAVERGILPLDLNAFSSLLDRQDEEFLREKLPRRQFTRIKRSRIKVTWGYVGRIFDNSAVVLRMVGMARQNSNLAAEEFSDMADLAAHLRTNCLIAFAKMGAEFMFPSLQLNPPILAAKYASLQKNMPRLQALQPQLAGQLASA